ncbi:hypothetical protein BDB00DRAFT_821088 [Zychaea mexicana]|uniref:uncharacterized protein n=1 Tax=Zychaea mexicana TaxID=64656 RepID=UPI0022FE8643|nr:uncharacterized protein BDB00DRAFT_821088 [Zychaea mexicana]KAI9493875.1 hypothetical protein BDB00DRAFT_821088 [Zychaea mexicana]
MIDLKKINERITRSKWIKIYLALVVIQGVLIIALESALASQNLAQARILPTFPPGQREQEPLDGIARQVNHVRIRLNRAKWENIAFVAIQIWFVVMAFDATIYQNASEVIALAVINLVCAALGGLQVIQAGHRIKTIQGINQDFDLNINVYSIRTVYYMTIVATACLTLFAFIFLYLSILVVREIGWVTYKKIGPDVGIQKMYTVFQLFVLALKIDVFVEFLVSCFYVTQFATESGFEWETWVELCITVSMLPMLYFARIAVAAEKRWQMIIFILFQLLVVAVFTLMIFQTMEPGNFWYTYIVAIGLVFAVVTPMLGCWTMYNFNKGLAPYIQRGKKKKEYPTKQQELHEQSPLQSSWQIDDD